jgi:hypothetical protein
VLPLTVVVPILSAEIVARRWPAIPGWASSVTVATVSAVQLVALYANARRSAVGIKGSWLFPLRPEWSPVLGWWPWLLLAAAGCGLLCTVRLLPRSRFTPASH